MIAKKHILKFYKKLDYSNEIMRFSKKALFLSLVQNNLIKKVL